MFCLTHIDNEWQDSEHNSKKHHANRNHPTKTKILTCKIITECIEILLLKVQYSENSDDDKSQWPRGVQQSELLVCCWNPKGSYKNHVCHKIWTNLRLLEGAVFELLNQGLC